MKQKRHWRSTKQKLGQHFLIDDEVVTSIVELADIRRDDVVLEIGAGHGVLTSALASRAGSVIALELDRQFCQSLREKLSTLSHVEVVHADAMTYRYDALPPGFKIVANLPYTIASPLFVRLLEMKLPLADMTLMFQKEVAERIVAEPGGRRYGFLSVVVQLYADVQLSFIVPSSAFSPPPKVESAVIKVKPLKKPRIEVHDEVHYLKLVKALFAQRRKTVLNNLKHAPFLFSQGSSFQACSELLRLAGIDPQRRGETFTLEEFERVSRAILYH
ncbi:MAG: ribosomal RNA small subunit methyltransferase A [Candidatus Tectomicrobia bacterium]|nr:ribosomal RNA small subunit methyltransferase A [Candidatus Tectomicrobia bacterium]